MISYVQQFFSLVEQHRIPEAGKYLSEDFTCSGLMPEPLRKQGYLDLLQSLVDAFPDLKFNLSGFTFCDGTLHMKFNVAGTQSDVLLLPFTGMQQIAATGTRIELPEEPAEVTQRNGAIASITVTEVSGGGVEGILQQIAAKTDLPVPSIPTY